MQDDFAPLKPLKGLRMALVALLLVQLTLTTIFALAFDGGGINAGDPITGGQIGLVALSLVSGLISLGTVVVAAIWVYNAWENFDVRTGMPMPAGVALALVLIPIVNAIGTPIVAFMLLRACPHRLPGWFVPWLVLGLAGSAVPLVDLILGKPTFGAATLYVNIGLTLANTAGLLRLLFLVEAAQMDETTALPGLPDYSV